MPDGIDFVLDTAGGRLHDDFVALVFAHQRPGDGRDYRDLAEATSASSSPTIR